MGVIQSYTQPYPRRTWAKTAGSQPRTRQPGTSWICNSRSSNPSCRCVCARRRRTRVGSNRCPWRGSTHKHEHRLDEDKIQPRHWFTRTGLTNGRHAKLRATLPMVMMDARPALAPAGSTDDATDVNRSVSALTLATMVPNCSVIIAACVKLRMRGPKARGVTPTPGCQFGTWIYRLSSTECVLTHNNGT
jgi:hypothetical protein